MNSKEFEDNFEKFCLLHNIYWVPKRNDWNKNFRNRLKTVRENGVLVQKFDGWQLGPIKYLVCRYCFKELADKQRKFCSPKCRVLGTQIRNKLEELKAESIFWTKPPGHYRLPERRGMLVTSKNGTKRQLTKKKGKSKNPYAF